LAPLTEPKEKSHGDWTPELMDITKTKNYANCDKRIAYNFGVPQESNWKNSAAHPDNFMKVRNERIIRFFIKVINLYFRGTTTAE
jgi:hypothetical protein